MSSDAVPRRGCIRRAAARPEHYENRVYQVGSDEGQAVSRQVYGRAAGSDAQIDEEHAFARELAEP